MKDGPRSPGGEKNPPPHAQRALQAADTRPGRRLSTQYPTLNKRSAEQQHVSHQLARDRRIQNLIAGGILALAALFVASTLLLIIGEKLIGQPIARIPLYTPRAITARPTNTSPPATPPAPAATAVPTPETTATLMPTEEPAPEETKVDLEAENETPDQAEALTFAVPVNSSVSTGFSAIHPALDFDATVGTAVVASAAGRVVFAGWSQRGHGNLVVIDHGLGWQSWYAHLERFSVSVGDWVCHSCPIGSVGNTGFSSAPHLHFEIRHGCTFYNLFTGATLSDDVGANYRFDPFGTPICVGTASPPTPSNGTINPDTEAGTNPVTPTGGKGLSDPDTSNP